MPLAPNQWRVLLYIIRKTYGFHLKVDYIANFEIGEATGLCKAVVSRCLKELEDHHLINRKGKFIGFQKDWEKWQGLAFQLTLSPKLAVSSTLLDNKSKQNRQQKLAEPSTKVSSAVPENSPIKDKRNNIYIRDKKKQYLFDNIHLLEEEYNKLIERFGEVDTKDRLETLSLYKKSKGKKYSSDYATILSWDKKNRKGGQGGTHQRSPRSLTPRDSYHKPADH